MLIVLSPICLSLPKARRDTGRQVCAVLIGCWVTAIHAACYSGEQGVCYRDSQSMQRDLAGLLARDEMLQQMMEYKARRWYD